MTFGDRPEVTDAPLPTAGARSVTVWPRHSPRPPSARPVTPSATRGVTACSTRSPRFICSSSRSSTATPPAPTSAHERPGVLRVRLLPGPRLVPLAVCQRCSAHDRCRWDIGRYRRAVARHRTWFIDGTGASMPDTPDLTPRVRLRRHVSNALVRVPGRQDRCPVPRRHRTAPTPLERPAADP